MSAATLVDTAQALVDACRRVPSADHSPWPVAFSFGQAIQVPTLQIWRGEDTNVAAAQRGPIHRAACNGAALDGAYTLSMEHEPALEMAS